MRSSTFTCRELSVSLHTLRLPVPHELTIGNHDIYCTFLKYVQVEIHKMWRYSLGLAGAWGRGRWVLCHESPASVLHFGIRHPVGVTGDSDSLHSLFRRLSLNPIIVLLGHIHPLHKIIGFIFTFSYCSDLDGNVPHRIDIGRLVSDWWCCLGIFKRCGLAGGSRSLGARLRV